jgi:hypothetical protein
MSVEWGFAESEPAADDGSGAARLKAGAQAQRLEEPEAPLQVIPGHLPTGRTQREILHEALEAVWAENRAQAQRFEAARAQLQAIAEWIETDRPQREVLRESAFARLQARLESLPVIEQAKGIVMAQQRCGPDEAFELLRRASQRANVKVHVLAAQIVAHVASPAAEATVKPARPRSSGRL